MNRAQLVQQNADVCVKFGKNVLTEGEIKFVSKFASDGATFTQMFPVWRKKGTPDEYLGFFPKKVDTDTIDPKIFNKLARLALKVRANNKVVELRK
jgi:hypothetical protein